MPARGARWWGHACDTAKCGKCSTKIKCGMVHDNTNAAVMHACVQTSCKVQQRCAQRAVCRKTRKQTRENHHKRARGKTKRQRIHVNDRRCACAKTSPNATIRTANRINMPRAVVNRRSAEKPTAAPCQRGTTNRQMLIATAPQRSSTDAVACAARPQTMFKNAA